MNLSSSSLVTCLSWLLVGEITSSLQIFMSGGPKSRLFPAYEEGSKDCSWVLRGIFPSKLLKDKFM